MHVFCTCSSDEMEFEVGTDTRTGKLIARRVVRLPTGTVSFESISEDRLLGKVDCEPKIISGISCPDNTKRGNKVSENTFMVTVKRIIYIIYSCYHLAFKIGTKSWAKLRHNKYV